MRLQKKLFFSLFENWLLITIVFLPLLCLSDFLFHEHYKIASAIAKVPVRYSQSLPIIGLWAAWINIKRMRKKYTDIAFISIGFKKINCLPFVLFFGAFLCFLEFGVIIPSNDKLFSAKNKITNWIIKEKKECTFFIQTIDDEKADLWMNCKNKQPRYCQASIKDNLLSVKKCKYVDDPIIGWKEFYEKFDLQIKIDDFYTIWQPSRKLSWKGLKEAKKYWEYNNQLSPDLKLQWHVYLSRGFLIIAMLLFGTALAWQSGIKWMIFCSIISTWIAQSSMFIDWPFNAIMLWSNSFSWIFVGLWALF